MTFPLGESHRSRMVWILTSWWKGGHHHMLQGAHTPGCELHTILQDQYNVSKWITTIQPPGLMKMRLMHHQEHHEGHKNTSKQSRPCMVLVGSLRGRG